MILGFLSSLLRAPEHFLTADMENGLQVLFTPIGSLGVCERLGDIMVGFKVGQRVGLVEESYVSPTVLSLHGDDLATVLRSEMRQGKEHCLVQFDRLDIGFGLYWLPSDQLIADCS